MFAEREGGGHRARLRPDETYVAMQLAVVFAKRSGPLTDIEWAQLWGMAQDLAERFDGSIEAPEQDEVIQRAKELDQQCAALDAQVGLILWLPGTAPLADLSRVLPDVGFLPYGRQLSWIAVAGTPGFTALFDGVRKEERRVGTTCVS